MTIHERATRLYCEKKGIDPNAPSTSDGWNTNVSVLIAAFEEFELKLWCLKQAENTK